MPRIRVHPIILLLVLLLMGFNIFFTMPAFFEPIRDIMIVILLVIVMAAIKFPKGY